MTLALWGNKICMEISLYFDNKYIVLSLESYYDENKHYF